VQNTGVASDRLPWVRFLWHDLMVASRQRRIDPLFDGWCHRLNPRPTGRGEHDDGVPATIEVLLVAKLLVGGDKPLEARLLRYGEQVAAFQGTPPTLKSNIDLVWLQELAQGHRRALIKEPCVPRLAETTRLTKLVSNPTGEGASKGCRTQWSMA